MPHDHRRTRMYFLKKNNKISMNALWKGQTVYSANKKDFKRLKKKKIKTNLKILLWDGNTSIMFWYKVCWKEKKKEDLYPLVYFLLFHGDYGSWVPRWRPVERLWCCLGGDISTMQSAAAKPAQKREKGTILPFVNYDVTLCLIVM